MFKRFGIKLVQTYLMLMVIPVGLGILVHFADPEQGGLTIFKAFMLAPFFHIAALVFSSIVGLIAMIFGNSGDAAGDSSATSGFHDVGGSDGGAF